MLDRSQKAQLVQQLQQDFQKAQGLFLTNLIGVKGPDSATLRKELRELGAKVVVARNTLLQKASEGTPFEAAMSDLKGPHAVALSFGEEFPAMAKCLKRARQDHEVVELKGGFLNGGALSPEQILALADLPSRPEMLATLLATFQAPISAFVRALRAVGEKKDSQQEGE